MAPETQTIDEFLFNQRHRNADHLKIHPSRSDFPVFEKILNKQSTAALTASHVVKAFTFFKQKLKHSDEFDGPADPARILRAVTQGLVVVSIELDRSDNPYAIFESLNFKGLDLTQSDLAKNYLMMRFAMASSLDRQEMAYHEYWKVLEDLFPQHQLESFLRLFLLKQGRPVEKRAVFAAFKRQSEDCVTLEDLTRFSKRLIWTAREYARIQASVSATRPGPDRILRFLRDVKAESAMPIALTLLEYKSNGSLTENELTRGLSALESYLVRRYVCQFDSKAHAKVFLSASDRIVTNSEPSAVAELLRTLSELRGDAEWPSDDKFFAGFRRRWIDSEEMSRYRQDAMVKWILWRFEEEERGHRGIQDQMSDLEDYEVVPVLPRSLSEAWDRDLGANRDRALQLVDSIGNMILLPVGDSYVDQPYFMKRGIFSSSRMAMCRSVAGSVEWGSKQIESRVSNMANAARTVWSRS